MKKFALVLLLGSGCAGFQGADVQEVIEKSPEVVLSALDSAKDVYTNFCKPAPVSEKLVLVCEQAKAKINAAGNEVNKYLEVLPE